MKNFLLRTINYISIVLLYIINNIIIVMSHEACISHLMQENQSNYKCEPGLSRASPSTIVKEGVH